jgi:hypothetical protein
MAQGNKWILIFAAVAATVSAAKCADDANSLPSERLDVGITLDYFGKYIWRGQNLNNESVFQPSIYLSKYGFTGSIWGSQDWTGANNNAGNVTEIDYTLDYTNTIPGIDWLSGSAGVIHYTFPHTDSASTTEVYGGLTLTSVPLNPSIKIYRDVDEIKGTYYQFGVGHTFEKINKWNEQCYCNFVVGASIGYGNGPYNKGYFGSGGGNMNDLTLTAGLPVCLGSWTLKPSINYATMLSDPIRAATDKSDNLWGGLSLSKSF